VSRYEQIERDLQCGGNGRELLGRAAASTALEICNVAPAASASATWANELMDIVATKGTDSPEAAELDILTDLIEHYESRHWPV
jgi:hypothetical protein